MSSKLEIQKERLRLLEEKQKIREGLPHLHGYKFFKWSRAFFDSTNRFNFLSSANQVGKSSCQIRKAIHWATAKHLWPQLWPNKQPYYFFYLYPSLKLATREFKHKWVPEFLPRGEFKDHPVYGWKEEYKGGEISGIHFNSGVSILFLSYSMSAEDLQASSPSAIFCDEEIPVQIYPELVMRLEATKGYFHLVCTPTLGQKFFQDIFEKRTYPEAFAVTISMYHCIQYEDGSPGMYTVADIKRREAMLGTQAEIDMRVHGKFVKTEGLVYSSFSRERNYMPADGPVPDNWLWFSGVDPGSGGARNHPAAIAFIAVSPDFKQGRVVETWRGSNIEITTSEDVLKKYIQMRGDRVMTGEFYDWADKDFHTISGRSGMGFQKASKEKKSGINLMNALFKNQMLIIDENDDNFKYVEELESLREDTNLQGKGAINDLCDAVRYAAAPVFWDFTGIRQLLSKPMTPKKEIIDERMAGMKPQQLVDLDEVEAEIEEWNEQYGE